MTGHNVFPPILYKLWYHTLFHNTKTNPLGRKVREYGERVSMSKNVCPKNLGSTPSQGKVKD